MIFVAVSDRIFNTNVVVFRWIMTSKIGTKIVVTRCVCEAQNIQKLRLCRGSGPLAGFAEAGRGRGGRNGKGREETRKERRGRDGRGKGIAAEGRVVGEGTGP